MSDHQYLNVTQERAERRVKTQLGFLMHLGVFIGVNITLAVLAAQQGRSWNLYPLLGWGVGLAIHGLMIMVKPALHDRLMARALRQGPSTRSAP